MKDNDVELWLVNLSLFQNDAASLQKLLSQEELEKAKRFANEELQTKFIITHGLLHSLLMRYLGTKETTLSYTEFGKPYLYHARAQIEGLEPHLSPAFFPELFSPTLKVCQKKVQEKNPGKSTAPNPQFVPARGISSHLQFNMSDSQNLALYGFTNDSPIGVDVEYIRESIANEPGIEDLVFSESEKKMYRQIPPNEKVRTFFRVWTQKEAIRKALGIGLLEPLQNLEVSLVGKNEILKIEKNDPKEWSLYSYDEGDAIVSCAVKKRNTQISLNIIINNEQKLLLK